MTRTNGPVVVLVGAPGSGKTTIGKLLAKRWSVDFRDTDHDVEASTGSSVADLFVEHGEPHFRQLEQAAVAEALATHTGVLALGGGAVMSDETRALLEGHVVVHLDVGLAAAMRRLEMNRSRPLLVGNVRAQWQQLAEQRRPLYAEVAQVTISTDDRTPKEVAELVAAAIDGVAEGNDEGDRVQ